MLRVQTLGCPYLWHCAFGCPCPTTGTSTLRLRVFTSFFCPVIKMFHGPSEKPTCTQSDPILTGCWGLPSPLDPNPPIGLPLCDPAHELLLTFPKAGSNAKTNAQQNTSSSPYVMLAGDSLFISLEVRVPLETPSPRAENVFRVRVLDESKLTLDGKLNEFGGEVRDMPRVENFKIWWTRALPDRIITVALEFTFNLTISREQELAGQSLRVIQIVAPDGLKMAVRRPRDVTHLAPSSSLGITVWNWTGTMPRGLWFGLDEKRNVTGKFHYAFPVLLPGEGEMPYNNLWSVKLCADSPFCKTELLEVPLPGFFFGEEPDYDLSQEAFDALMGNHGPRCTQPLALCWFWLPWLLLASAAAWPS
mmetsp:Transcript_30231/g.100108  ORF Transcript_30231/g.100108 Transcript_30231/m.100108 type:complete len:362 (+) Transcript_30231:4601-5686(+)